MKKIILIKETYIQSIECVPQLSLHGRQVTLKPQAPTN